MDGFWMAPKALAQLLAERKLTQPAYLLLHFLAESGADRPEGFATSSGWLVSATGLGKRTVRRRLRELREKHLIDYPDHERVATFTVHIDPELWKRLRPPLAPRGDPEVASGSAATSTTETARKSALEAGKAVVPSAATSRARAKIKTKTSPRGLGLGSTGPAEAAPTTPQEAASSAPELNGDRRPRCPFTYRDEEGRTIPCDVKCYDDAELAEHLLRVHRVQPAELDYEPVPPPYWPQASEGGF